MVNQQRIYKHHGHTDNRHSAPCIECAAAFKCVGSSKRMTLSSANGIFARCTEPFAANRAKYAQIVSLIRGILKSSDIIFGDLLMWHIHGTEVDILRAHRIVTGNDLLTIHELLCIRVSFSAVYRYGGVTFYARANHKIGAGEQAVGNCNAESREEKRALRWEMPFIHSSTHTHKNKQTRRQTPTENMCCSVND